MLLIGCIIGLHIPYLTRPGMLLSRSISIIETDYRNNYQAYYGILCKLGFIFTNISLHLFYIYYYNIQFLLRINLYIFVISLLVFINYLGNKENYYFHAHHWCMGLILLPLCINFFSLYSWFLYGISLSQFIEGSARWSIAPLFHKYPSSTSDSTIPLTNTSTLVNEKTISMNDNKHNNKINDTIRNTTYLSSVSMETNNNNDSAIEDNQNNNLHSNKKKHTPKITNNNNTHTGLSSPSEQSITSSSTHRRIRSTQNVTI